MEFILSQLNSYLWGFLWFGVGVLLGFIIVMIIYFASGKFTRKKSKNRNTADPSKIIGDAALGFLCSDTGSDYKAKTAAFTNSVNYMFENIGNLYYLPEITKYKILSESELFGDGLTTNLEFSIIELLDFADNVITGVQAETEKVLLSKDFSNLYRAYRFISYKSPKDPRDVKFSVVYSIIFKKKEQKKELGFFSKAFEKITSAALNIVAKVGYKVLEPTIQKNVDGFFEGVIYTVGDNVNKLYSHYYSEENKL